MFIRISSDKFYTSLTKLVPNNSKSLMNFRVVGNKLTMQLIGNIYTEDTIDIDERSAGEDMDITITVNPAILLMDKQKPVEIDMLPDVINIIQENYSFSATKEWESRYELPEWDDSIAQDFDWKAFTAAVQNSRTLDGIAKLTKQPYSNITFYNGHVYSLYSNVLLRQEMNVGNFSMTAETARNLLRLLDVQCRYILNKEKGYIYIKTKYKYIYALIQSIDLQEIKNIESRLGECDKVEDISLIGTKEDIDSVVKVYKNAKVTFSIVPGSMNLLVSDGRSNFVYGKRGIPKLSMQFTIAHLSTINRVFGEQSNIEVLTGGNILCLKKDRLTLLMSGTLF